MTDFEKLKQEVESGIRGENQGIPIGFRRLNRYIGIRKRIFTVIAGAPGSGKSAFVHSAYILSPFDWYIANKDKCGIKFKVILFSMERSKVYIYAKWLSRKIFLDQGIYIPIPKLLGWWDEKLTKDEHDLFLMYEEYLNSLLEVVDVIENIHNPTGIFKYVKEYAARNGTVEEIDEYHKVYIPNQSNEVVEVILDHAGLCTQEKGMSTKKEAVDRMVEHIQKMRDFYGYTPIVVNQFNRALSNPAFLKIESVEPTLEDLKETGNTAEAADVVITLFEPLRHRTSDPKYKAEKFVSPITGSNYFRSMKIVKNSYGEDSVRAGLAFMGSTGIFAELPKSTEMEGFEYDELFNNNYFLK